MQSAITLDRCMYDALMEHLLHQPHDLEEAAFLLARVDENAGGLTFIGEELVIVPPDGFEFRSEMYLELTDEFRADVIQRAWRAKTALVEFHSHPRQQTPARFSPSDIRGLREFVPHIWWRLDDRPYAAVVVAKGSFDGLVWHSRPTDAEALCTLEVEGRVLHATGLSETDWRQRRDAI